MEKKRLLFAIAPVILGLGAACSSARGDERAADGRDSGSGDTVTITGCLTAGPDGKFALTAAPGAAVTAAARAMDDERNTSAYVLIGGDNLEAHLGKRVEVTGTVSGKTQDVEQHERKQTPAASAPATDGRDTPVVKTETEIDLQVRQLTVREIRDVAPTCVVQ